MKNRSWLIAMGLFGLLTAGCAMQDSQENDNDAIGDGVDRSDQDEDPVDVDHESRDDFDLPLEIHGFLDKVSLEALVEAGMKIHYGNRPPQIEGIYRLNAPEVIFDEQRRWLSVAEYTYTLFDQSDDGRISMNFEATGSDDLADGVDAFIVGRDDCFSIFINAEGLAGGCAYQLPSVISGCLEGDGIAQWRHGMVMGENTAQACAAVIPEGYRRIVTESDGLARRLSQDNRTESPSATVERGGPLVGLGQTR